MSNTELLVSSRDELVRRFLIIIFMLTVLTPTYKHIFMIMLLVTYMYIWRIKKQVVVGRISFYVMLYMGYFFTTRIMVMIIMGVTLHDELLVLFKPTMIMSLFFLSMSSYISYKDSKC